MDDPSLDLPGCSWKISGKNQLIRKQKGAIIWRVSYSCQVGQDFWTINTIFFRIGYYHCVTAISFSKNRKLQNANTCHNRVSSHIFERWRQLSAQDMGVATNGVLLYRRLLKLTACFSLIACFWEQGYRQVPIRITKQGMVMFNPCWEKMSKLRKPFRFVGQATKVMFGIEFVANSKTTWQMMMMMMMMISNWPCIKFDFGFMLNSLLGWSGLMRWLLEPPSILGFKSGFPEHSAFKILTWAMKKGPLVVYGKVYRGWQTTHLCRDYNKPL